MTQHDRAGENFNLVNGCKYMLVLNLFREGGNMRNPVKAVKKLTIITGDGKALVLLPKPLPAQVPTGTRGAIVGGLQEEGLQCEEENDPALTGGWSVSLPTLRGSLGDPAAIV